MVAVTTTLAAVLYLLSTTTPAAFAFQNTNTGVVLLPAVPLLRLRMSSTVLEAPSTNSTTAGTILAPGRPQKTTEGIVHEDENEENIVVLQNEPPSLSTIRKTMLPKAVFDIDTKTSLFYFAVDLLAVVTSMGLLKTVVTSSFFQASPLLGQILLAAPLQTLTGTYEYEYSVYCSCVVVCLFFESCWKHSEIHTFFFVRSVRGTSNALILYYFHRVCNVVYVVYWP